MARKAYTYTREIIVDLINVSASAEWCIYLHLVIGSDAAGNEKCTLHTFTCGGYCPPPAQAISQHRYLMNFPWRNMERGIEKLLSRREETGGERDERSDENSSYGRVSLRARSGERFALFSHRLPHPLRALKTVRPFITRIMKLHSPNSLSVLRKNISKKYFTNYCTEYLFGG